MANRQFRVKTPQLDTPHDRVTWAMDELHVLVSSVTAIDDVVSRGMVVPKGTDSAHGGLYVRRGWRRGMSVGISARTPTEHTVDVAVVPTSRLQSALLTVAFFVCVLMGLSAGCVVGGLDRLAYAVVGVLGGALVGVFVAAGVQRIGLAVTADASASVDALAADIGRWAEQRNA